MADDSKFSAAQKLVVSGMPGWKIFSIHSNGDITVEFNGKRIRLTKEGKIVGQMEMLEPSVKKFLESGPIKSKLSSLSSDLTSSIKSESKKAKSTHWGGVTSFKTVCQEHPACCKPRRIKGVFLDADHTIWDLAGTAAGVTGPIKLVDENTVVETGSGYQPSKYSKWNIEDYMSKEEKELLKGLSAGEKDFLLEEMAKEHNNLEPKPIQGTGKETVRTTIKLDPTFRPLVAELKKRNIPMAVISLNTPGSVKRIFREFGLEDAFVEIRDSYENKGKVFHEMTGKMGICACDSIFVDDNRTNVMDVNDKCGVSLQIGPGKDIEKIGDLLKFVED